MDSLLSRFAEDSYWLARYVERAESLARILEVTRSFEQTGDTHANWGPILDLFEDRKAYRSKYGALDHNKVARFYLLDRDNPNSVASSIEFAHNNARSLRHLISVEMWTLINMFANQLGQLRTRDIAGAKLTRVCESVRNQCQLFQGSTLNTLYRDQVWHFYRLGRLIERSDQIARLVEIKTRPVTSRANKDEMTDVSQWHTLLRSASAYHGYLRAYPRELSATTVSAFILLNPSFPMSAAFCANEMADTVEQLKPAISTAHYRGMMRQVRTIKRLVKPRQSIDPEQLSELLRELQLAVARMHVQTSATLFPEG